MALSTMVKFIWEQMEQLINLPFIAIPNMLGYINLFSDSLICIRDAGPHDILILFRNATYVFFI